MDSNQSASALDVSESPCRDSSVLYGIGLIEPILAGSTCIVSIGDDKYRIGDAACETSDEVVELHFRTRSAFAKLCRSPQLLTLGELYVGGDLNVHGSMRVAANLACRFPDKPRTILEKTRSALACLFQGVGRHKITSAEHYSLNPHLYESFLDPYMQYTCGLFQSESDDLATAQEQKLALLANAVEAAPGKEHLDIGCGWGGALVYLSQRFNTRSTGITNCSAHAAYASDWMKRENAGGNVICGDFSQMNRTNAFDAATIVGMVEHVSPSRQSALFDRLYQCLRPGGRAYIQCITKSAAWTGGDGTRFLKKYVFPDHELDTAERICSRLQKSGLAIDEVLNHGQHYALTADRWVERLESQQQRIISAGHVSEETFRVLYGYLAVGAKIFHDGGGALHRIFAHRPR